MEYVFDFVSTHRDLTDAIQAGRTFDTGMRRFARIGVAGLGMMWLVGAVWALFSAQKASPAWLPLVWLLLGALVTWFFVVKPMLFAVRMRAKAPSEQALVVKFGDAGIHVTTSEAGRFDRTWEEVILVLPARRGIGFIFKQRPNHWLPARVFATQAQRIEFVEFVQAKTNRVRNWRDRRVPGR